MIARVYEFPWSSEAGRRRSRVVAVLGVLLRRYSTHAPADARGVAWELWQCGVLSEDEYQEVAARLHERRLRFYPVRQEKPECWTEPEGRR